MRRRTSHPGRRSFALVLAYLLALQVILAAWAVLVPTAVTALGVQTVICTTHAYGSVPSSDLPLAQCPCGPLCHAGGHSAGGVPPPAAASLVVFRTVVAAKARPSTQQTFPRRIASEPEQARAPPVLT
jgi:hypothetical protein